MAPAQSSPGSRLFAVTADMLLGHTLDVRKATFVLGSPIAPCCSPSALCFRSRAYAVRFARAFGGTALAFEAAMARMHREMTHGEPSAEATT